MSEAFTTIGQTRINELRGLEQPLVIDRIVFAYKVGQDHTQPVDRSQQMPDAGEIVHTAIIDPNSKGYVDPDQVVYSVILGSDLGDFSFNWLGLVEEGTNTIIAISTIPDTQKYKTNLAQGTTGNTLTRNFLLQAVDAQNLTGITVQAETWQFDYMAMFSTHEQQIVDPAKTGTTGKHVTEAQAKKWEDHAKDPHNYAAPNGDIDKPFNANYLVLANNEENGAETLANGSLSFDVNDENPPAALAGDSQPPALFLTDGGVALRVWHNKHFTGIGTGATEVARGDHTHATGHTLISTRTTTGAWTITGVDPNKLLFLIAAGSTQTSGSYAKFYVSAGTDCEGSGNSSKIYSLGSSDANSTQYQKGISSAIKPNATTVTVQVVAAPAEFRAYQ